MTAGASRVELKITRQPVLAPSPQPRPAPTARALPPKHAGKGGQNWTPIGGQICKPIDSSPLKPPAGLAHALFLPGRLCAVPGHLELGSTSDSKRGASPPTLPDSQDQNRGSAVAV